MKLAPLSLLFAIALALMPAYTSRADAPAPTPGAGAPAFLQPWTVAELRASLTVGAVLKWDRATDICVLGRRVHKHPRIEVIAAGDDGVTLRCTSEIAWTTASGAELQPVSWEEDLPWADVMQRLCPHLPLAAAAGKPANVTLELDGAAHDALFYVVERADGAERFWFDADRAGLLLRYEREQRSSVNINGEAVSLSRVVDSYTAVESPAAERALAPAR